MEDDSRIFLSVVLCTYNDELHIASSIASILSQTYPYFELIVVNDGSTDRTLDIVKSFDDGRIVVIDKEHSGLPDSLNVGIKAARYDWIARMDGDDIALKDRFEKQVRHLSDNVDIIGGQFILIDPEGGEVPSSVSRKPLSDFRCRLFLSVGMSPFAHPTVLARKSLIVGCGGYDANFIAAQDLDLWTRLAPVAKMANIPDVVLEYRRRGGAESAPWNDNQLTMAFYSFAKRALRINRAMSRSEFVDFEYEFSGLAQRNNILFKRSHDRTGWLGRPSIACYYLWRLLVMARIRICRRGLVK